MYTLNAVTIVFNAIYVLTEIVKIALMTEINYKSMLLSCKFRCYTELGGAHFFQFAMVWVLSRQSFDGFDWVRSQKMKPCSTLR